MNRILRSGLIAVVSALLVAYLVWEIYWYDQVGIGFISWHTHLMLYIYFCLLLFAISRFFKSKLSGNILLSAFVTAIMLFLIEGGLIIAKRKETYPDNSFGHYFSYYNSRNASYYHTWPSGKPHYLKKFEYNYIRQTNSLGFADREWEEGKRAKCRIMALGDSFTEGDGAPQDSSYVEQLSTLLNKDTPRYEVMNAGTCGSDPFFNYINYQDRLTKYKPDILLQSLSAGDVLTDMATKDGFRRFEHKPAITFKKAPWWEPIYAISHISRLMFYALGYNDMLVKGDPTREQKNDYNRQLTDLFVRYDSLAKANNTKLFIVIRPNTIKDIITEQPGYDFDPVLKPLAGRTGAVVVDLIPLYRQYMKQSGKDPQDFFWPVDGHHNSKGYHLMAELIARSVFGLDSTSKCSFAPGADK